MWWSIYGSISFFPRNKKRQKKPLPFTPPPNPPRPTFFKLGKPEKGGGNIFRGLVGLLSHIFGGNVAAASFFLSRMCYVGTVQICAELSRDVAHLIAAVPFHSLKKKPIKKIKPRFVSPPCCCRIRLCGWCWWVWIREGITHNSFFPFLSQALTNSESWSQKRKIHQSLLL